MPIEVRLLKPGNAQTLARVAPDVFDQPIDPRLSAEFAADPRHHLAVALDDGTVVGMASAVHYVHPDKPPELWINEVGVAPPYQRTGIGRRLMKALFDLGRELGCREAWVATEPDNEAANGLYAAVGGEPEPCVVYSFELEDSESEAAEGDGSPSAVTDDDSPAETPPESHSQPPR